MPCTDRLCIDLLKPNEAISWTASTAPHRQIQEPTCLLMQAVMPIHQTETRLATQYKDPHHHYHCTQAGWSLQASKLHEALWRKECRWSRWSCCWSRCSQIGSISQNCLDEWSSFGWKMDHWLWLWSSMHQQCKSGSWLNMSSHCQQLRRQDAVHAMLMSTVLFACKCPWRDRIENDAHAAVVVQCAWTLFHVPRWLPVAMARPVIEMTINY